jgi:hypothetical protein
MVGNLGVYSGCPLIVDHKLVASVEYHTFQYGRVEISSLFVISFTSRVTWKDGPPFMVA